MKYPLFTKDRSFYRTLVILAIPIALQNFISYGVNFMDNLMIGGFGETQISAAAGLARNCMSASRAGSSLKATATSPPPTTEGTDPLMAGKS